MSRLIDMAQLALPLAGGVAALLARVLHGGARPWLATSLVVLGGVLLGWAVALMLASTSSLVGHDDGGDGDDSAVDRQIQDAVAARRERKEEEPNG